MSASITCDRCQKTAKAPAVGWLHVEPVDVELVVWGSQGLGGDYCSERCLAEVANERTWHRLPIESAERQARAHHMATEHDLIVGQDYQSPAYARCNDCGWRYVQSLPVDLGSRGGDA